MKIFILLCHYGDNLKMTKACVNALYKYDNVFDRILIANNNKEELKAKDIGIQKNIEIVNNRKNLGYGGGINSLIQHSLLDDYSYLFFINNDCLITEKFLKKLVVFADQHKNVGIVAPSLRHTKNGSIQYDIGGKLNRIGIPFHEERENIKKLRPRKVDFAGCILVKKEVIKKIGGFDENFFLYYEDIDFSLRAKRNGYDTFVVPQVSIFHGGSKTVGVESDHAIYHQTRSAIIFLRKYYAWSVKAPFFLANFFLVSGKRLLKKPTKTVLFINAVRDGIYGLIDKDML